MVSIVRAKTHHLTLPVLLNYLDLFYNWTSLIKKWCQGETLQTVWAKNIPPHPGPPSVHFLLLNITDITCKVDAWRNVSNGEDSLSQNRSHPTFLCLDHPHHLAWNGQQRRQDGFLKVLKPSTTHFLWSHYALACSAVSMWGLLIASNSCEWEYEEGVNCQQNASQCSASALSLLEITKYEQGVKRLQWSALSGPTHTSPSSPPSLLEIC